MKIDTCMQQKHTLHPCFRNYLPQKREITMASRLLPSNRHRFFTRLIFLNFEVQKNHQKPLYPKIPHKLKREECPLKRKTFGWVNIGKTRRLLSPKTRPLRVQTSTCFDPPNISLPIFYLNFFSAWRIFPDWRFSRNCWLSFMINVNTNCCSFAAG